MIRIAFLLIFSLFLMTILSVQEVAGNENLIRDVDEEDEVILERVARSPDAQPDPLAVRRGGSSRSSGARNVRNARRSIRTRYRATRTRSRYSRRTNADSGNDDNDDGDMAGYNNASLTSSSMFTILFGIISCVVGSYVLYECC